MHFTGLALPAGDNADVVVAAFTEDGHVGGRYELTGPVGSAAASGCDGFPTFREPASTRTPEFPTEPYLTRLRPGTTAYFKSL